MADAICVALRAIKIQREVYFCWHLYCKILFITARFGSHMMSICHKAVGLFVLQWTSFRTTAQDIVRFLTMI